MPDIKRMQKGAHRQIMRWNGGAAKNGKLVKTDGTSRLCTIGRMDIKPTERGLYIDGANKFAISAYDLSVAPDFESEVIVFKGQQFRIILPVSAPTPDGNPVYWTAVTMYSGPST